MGLELSGLATARGSEEVKTGLVEALTARHERGPHDDGSSYSRHRVVWITTGWPPEVSGVSLGNAERAAWLADHGSLDVVVLAPDWPGHSLASDQSPLSVVRYPSKSWLPYRLTRVPRLGARSVIERTLDEVQPHAVVLTDVERAFFFASWCLPGLRWAREHGVPYVAHYHTDFDNFARRYPGWRRLRRVTRPVSRYLYRRVDATICATSSAAQQMRALQARRVYDIPFVGVDTSLLSPSRRDPEVLQRLVPGARIDGPVVVTLSRLAREKHVDQVIATMHEMAGSGAPPATLIVAGDGPPKVVRALRRLAAEGPASTRIHFVGMVHGEKKADLLAACDVFCTASPYETFGRALVEAMASGLVVVAPDSGAPPTYIDHGQNGYLFPAGDIVALTGVLTDIFTSETTGVRRQAIAAAAHHSVDASCRNLQSFYSTLLETRSFPNRIQEEVAAVS